MKYTYKNKPINLFTANITPINEIKRQLKIKDRMKNITKPDKIFDTESFDKIYREELENGFIKCSCLIWLSINQSIIRIFF